MIFRESEGRNGSRDVNRDVDFWNEPARMRRWREVKAREAAERGGVALRLGRKTVYETVLRHKATPSSG